MSSIDVVTVAQPPVVEVVDLQLEIGRRAPRARILRGVSFELMAGEMHALVGETGSGKSLTGRALVGLLPRFAQITGGRIRVEDTEVVGRGAAGMRALRGGVVGTIFQNARAALYPLRTVEDQMATVLQACAPLPRERRRARIHDLLEQVGIRDVARVARAHPHELSGGMAQRVVIATVLIAEPRIVIADEPTTGLDATVQRQILELLAGLQRDRGLSVLMITHDLSIVAQYCGAVSVMQAGETVEHGPVRSVLRAPAHPYTQRLLEASKLSDVERERAVTG